MVLKSRVLYKLYKLYKHKRPIQVSFIPKKRLSVYLFYIYSIYTYKI